MTDVLSAPSSRSLALPPGADRVPPPNPQGAGRLLIEHRHSHAASLKELAWTWQNNAGVYDALYVALDTRLGVPLRAGGTMWTGAL